MKTAWVDIINYIFKYVFYADESGSEEDEEDRLLRRTGDYLTSSDLLPKSFLNLRKVTSANKEQYTQVGSTRQWKPIGGVQLHIPAAVIIYN